MKIMKGIRFVIWLIFLYLAFIVMLSFGFFTGFLVIIIIIGGAILSQILYKIFYKKDQNFYEFILYPIIYILLILGSFLIPENITGLYKITQGENIIIFQGMHHIGTLKYYDTVINNINYYRKQGYTIVYEGIRMEETGTGAIVDKKLEKIFDGTDFLKNKHLFFEGDIITGNTLNSEDLNIDISNKDIETLFKDKEKNQQKYKKEVVNIQAVGDGGFILNEFIFKYKQKYITDLDYFLIKTHYNLGAYFTNEQQNTKKSILDSILKDYRNEYLVENIGKLEKNKIFIIYGEGHVQGVYDLLSKQSNRKILKLQELEPFDK